jgi:hypothetical protein
LRIAIAAQARQLVEKQFDVCRNSIDLRELFLTAIPNPHEAVQRVG